MQAYFLLLTNFLKLAITMHALEPKIRLLFELCHFVGFGISENICFSLKRSCFPYIYKPKTFDYILIFAIQFGTSCWFNFFDLFCLRAMYTLEIKSSIESGWKVYSHKPVTTSKFKTCSWSCSFLHQIFIDSLFNYFMFRLKMPNVTPRHCLEQWQVLIK